MSDSDEEEFLDLKIKWGDKVTDIYDVPRSVKNNDLFTMIFSELFRPELKLKGNKSITIRNPRFTINRWVKRTKFEENTIRGVLQMSNFQDENDGGEGEKSEKIAELEKELELLKMEKDAATKLEKNLRSKLSQNEAMLETNRVELQNRDDTISSLKEKVRTLEKSITENKSTSSPKLKRKKMKPPSKDSGLVLRSGVYVPNPDEFRFEENEWALQWIDFSNDNKRATPRSEDSEKSTFVGNVLFSQGGTYYYQVKLKIGNGAGMRIGVLHGELEPETLLEDQTKAWAFDCYCIFKEGVKSMYEGRNRRYGPRLKSGDYTVGVLVDFSSGGEFGEVTYFVDGVDYGVAFKQVVPPVRPAFTVWVSDDVIEFDQDFDVPT